MTSDNNQPLAYAEFFVTKTKEYGGPNMRELEFKQMRVEKAEWMNRGGADVAGLRFIFTDIHGRLNTMYIPDDMLPPPMRYLPL